MFKNKFTITAILIYQFFSPVIRQKETSSYANLCKMCKELLNPLLNIWRVQTQNNFVFLSGDYITGNLKANFTIFKSIITIPINKKWHLLNSQLILIRII
ncbi:MAG: hypothetical protein IMY72_12705 [Bacteroidetes bacterium]|nr:hypothetical protein [Bacteroidota bacterium]